MQQSQRPDRAPQQSRPPKLSNPHLAQSNGTRFPFTSPLVHDLAPGFRSRIGHENEPSNPYITPNTSQNPFIDDESDNTSGQDEFHLERYSEGTGTYRRRSQEHKKVKERVGESQNPQKRPKPGLNIITDFSNPISRSHADDLVVEKVPTIRPRVRERAVTASSQKVEHLDARATTQRGQQPDFANTKDLHRLKGQAKAGTSKTLPTARRTPQQEQHLNAHSESLSPARRSVIFGISVPEYQFNAHNPSEDATSALSMRTPWTPAITVTPAESSNPWTADSNRARGNRSRRQASSIYSQMLPTGKAYSAYKDVPPVPALPSHSKASPPRTMPFVDAKVSGGDSPGSESTDFDEEESDETLSVRQFEISEVRENIVQSSSDTARPSSTGWWNIVLSPMLSRAGTIASRWSPSIQNAVSPFPALREDRHQYSALSEPDEEDAPSRISKSSSHFNRSRASTWSQWTEWENDRDFAQKPVSISRTSAAPREKSHTSKGSGTIVHFMMGATPTTTGLATEYFQACAIEESTGVPYFQCQNHSCVERFRMLESSPDPPALVGAKKDMKSADRSMEGESQSLADIVTPRKTTNRRQFSDDSDMVLTELSPNVREAQRAVVGKASALINDVAPRPSNNKTRGTEVRVSCDSSSLPVPKRPSTPPAYSPPRPVQKAIKSVHSRDTAPQPVVTTPGPISPEMRHAMAPKRAMLMSNVSQDPLNQNFVNSDTSYPSLPPRGNTVPVRLADIDGPSKVKRYAEAKRKRLEKEDKITEKVGGLWRGRGCCPKNGCFGRRGREGRSQRRCYFMIFIGFLLVIATSVILATQLTRRGDQTPVDSEWLNLTGFPPIPTGISTVARPDVAVEVAGCAQPTTLWSCAVPKEIQPSIAPNDPDQPNFRFEIVFRNGTVAANATVPLKSRASERLPFGSWRLFSRQDDPFTNDLYAPDPAPPSLAEQDFLGNTTDGNDIPFDGETTPFFVTFISTFPLIPAAFSNSSSTSDLRSRQSSNSSIPDITSLIPPPDIAPDGTAAPANLLPDSPLPSSQPIRLYNRGLDTEHYGFYIYYDKAIFLKSTAALNATNTLGDPENDPDDLNGGSLESGANARCTWSQTRFLVRMWTSPDFGGQLLAGPTISPGNTLLPSPPSSLPSNVTSATDFVSTPGSFPYPISISIDRHGGDETKKALFCYGVDAEQHIIETDKAFVPEDRGFGGSLINPAPGFLQLPGSSSGNGFDPNAGGIDGGTGGCACEWRNWQ